MSKNTVTLISRDLKNKIICYKYMEEQYLKEGYVSSNIIHIKLLYKFFNLKIPRRIRAFFSLCLRCKFFLKNPKHTDYVILDSEHTKCIEEILANKNYNIVSTRIEQVNEIYISLKIIFYIIKNFFKRSLKQNYLIALIKIIAPKIVITQISDSEDFHLISKLMQGEIKFLAIQTYSPIMYQYNFRQKEKNNFYIPKLFCFGEYDELFYKKNKANIEAFEQIGSIQSSLCYEYVKTKKIEINPNKYDICLISEALPNVDGDMSHVKNLTDSIGLVAEFTHKLCKKHNLNLIFSGRAAKDQKFAKREICFYKHYLKNYNFEISQPNNSKDAKYPSYQNIMQSKLTIALYSTILREAICFEKKILSFNPVDHPDAKFPGPDIELSPESICTLNKTSYEIFEERVLKLLSITNDEYFNELGKEKFFIMKPVTDGANIVRKRLNEIVEGGNNNNIS
tara:strand:- start:3118 stop:4473 length:1356 start_codon:yes stop_codon:yes gene_type:complete